ncbi:MAG: hypothetical protein WB779_10150 [Ignavibacteriaceae bacterium]|jgi:hypothetical protein
MELKQSYKLFTPVLLGVLMFSSNFLNTNIFRSGDNNFSVWFVLSLLCFACGWFIDRTLNWIQGGKVVFATIVAATLISVVVVTFFKEYFINGEVMTETLILYTLRNITLGTMGFFGMAVAEVIHLEKDFILIEQKLKIFEDSIVDAKKEAELEIKAAKIKAQKIIYDAEAIAKNTFLKKERVENEIKEFIETEKELIKKYEDL